MSFNPSWIVTRLESNIAAFEGLLGSIEPSQARWKPSTDKWSILEVVNHLADEETEDFGIRLRLLLEDPAKEWPPIDPQRAAVERQYNNRNLAESLRRFIQSRRNSVVWLRELQGPNWEAANIRPSGDTLRAGDLLYSWLVHDMIHIRQINRLHYEYAASSDAGFSAAYAGTW